MLTSFRRFCCSAVAAAAFAAPAIAEERMVFCEEFTATWCVYCPPVAIALSNIMDANPDRFIFIQTHASDAFATTWGNQRMSFYNVPGFPTTWMDGTLQRVGQHSAATYQSDFNTRRNISTDVTMDLSADHRSGSTFSIAIDIGVESGGVARSMRVHILQILDHHPVGSHYRNCFVQNAPVQTITVQPGQTTRVETEFTLSGSSWVQTARDDVKIIAFVQATNPSGPAAIYQSGQLRWRDLMSTDLNGNGSVDLTDLAIMLANFGMTGDAIQSQGDTDGDQDVDLQDLTFLLGTFGI
jgi:thiol-disulfide isomerase/thioredoxin